MASLSVVLLHGAPPQIDTSVVPPRATPPGSRDPSPRSAQHSPDASSASSASSESGAGVCRICHGGERRLNLLLGGLCGCTEALVHLKCLETWLHYSAGRRHGRPPVCEVCLQEYALPRPLPPPSPGLAARLARRAPPNMPPAAPPDTALERCTLIDTLRDVRVPLLLALLYGYCSDLLVGLVQVPALQVAVMANLLLVVIWHCCVVRPNTAPWRLDDRICGLKDVLAWCLIYLTTLLGWALECLTLRGLSGFAHTHFCHGINAMFFGACVVLRLGRTCCPMDARRGGAPA